MGARQVLIMLRLMRSQSEEAVVVFVEMDRFCEGKEREREVALSRTWSWLS